MRRGRGEAVRSSLVKGSRVRWRRFASRAFLSVGPRKEEDSGGDENEDGGCSRAGWSHSFSAISIHPSTDSRSLT